MALSVDGHLGRVTGRRGTNMIKNYCTVVGLFGFLYSFLLGEDMTPNSQIITQSLSLPCECPP